MVSSGTENQMLAHEDLNARLPGRRSEIVCFIKVSALHVAPGHFHVAPGHFMWQVRPRPETQGITMVSSPFPAGTAIRVTSPNAQVGTHL